MSLPGQYLPGDPLPPGESAPLGIRWTEARKEEVLRRLDTGAVRLNEALSRWNLTLEEVEAWRSAHKVYGRRGLRLGVHRADVPEQGGLL
jgi:hypothetical protein